MKVNIKRVDTSLPMPAYQTAGAACFDLVARTDVTIKPHEVGHVPCNIIVETPPGYMLAVFSRSSAPRKKGLLIPHGVGIIDPDYSGPEDEVIFQCMNFTDKEVLIERGERVCQAGFVPVPQVELVEVEEVLGPTRGGFGSTGHK